LPEAGDLRKNLLSLPLAPDMRSTGPKKQGLSGRDVAALRGFGFYTRATPSRSRSPGTLRCVRGL